MNKCTRQVKIVIAPAAFKGSLSPLEAARAIDLGVRSALPQTETVLAPMADGGDGTLEAIQHSRGGAIHDASVSGPLGRTVRARWLLLSDGETGVIEMASASGLSLLQPGDRDPMRASTNGVGELIRDVLDKSCRHLIVGLGGSATVDGGAGVAQALGVGLYDRRGRSLSRGGGALAELEHIDLGGLDDRVGECRIVGAYDVSNPLLGPRGAAAVYGPQKGATPDAVHKLETGLSRLADVIRRDIGLDVAELPGAGAAGGLGAGLVAFLGAQLVSGVDLILKLTGFQEKLSGAHLVITGEGSLDSQSASGKAPVGVARVARDLRVPVLVLAGNLGQGYQALYQEGVDAAMSIVPGPMSLEDAQRDAYGLLADAAERAIRIIALGGRWASA